MKRYAQDLCTKLSQTPGGGLPLSTVQKYARQMCITIAELHSQNIVVADLKPQNILIDDFDECVISDFGISTILGNSRVIASDGVKGTFNYMAPEQFGGSESGICTKADAWSFACCIIEMVTGSRPWEDVSMPAICFKVATAGQAPQVPGGLPRQVRLALQACLSHDREQRPTFDELHAVFDAPWDQEVSSKVNSVPVDAETGSVEEMAAASMLDEAGERVSRLEREMQRERQAWAKERAEMKATHEAMAAKINQQVAEIESSQQEAARAKSLSSQLTERLQLVLNSLKCGERCSRCITNESLRFQLESQLVQCNEGLAKCIAQKDMCKEMLRVESSRSQRLARELEQLRASYTDREYCFNGDGGAQRVVGGESPSRPASDSPLARPTKGNWAASSSSGSFRSFRMLSAAETMILDHHDGMGGGGGAHSQCSSNAGVNLALGGSQSLSSSTSGNSEASTLMAPLTMGLREEGNGGKSRLSTQLEALHC